MTDREKMIDLLDNVASNILQFPTDGFIEHLADYLLANGVTVKQWIPVSEPPEEPNEYIVMIKGAAEATTLLFDGSYWFEEDEDGWVNYYAVTHWMPLPEPPESEGDGEA